MAIDWEETLRSLFLARPADSVTFPRSHNPPSSLRLINPNQPTAPLSANEAGVFVSKLVALVTALRDGMTAKLPVHKSDQIQDGAQLLTFEEVD